MEIDWVVNQNKFTTATDFEETLLHFDAVWHVYLDCKSTILSTANKELEKWVFPIGEEKWVFPTRKKNKKQKTQTSGDI